MRTPKSPALPQRKERNAFQAGCREFESRPPLQEKPHGGAKKRGAPQLGAPLHFSFGSSLGPDDGKTPNQGSLWS